MSSRKIAIKYQVQGNKAVVRAMREIESETGRSGAAAADATLKEKSFAAALLERSSATDKALKKTEGLFAGSDRLLSIVGKVTGALGLAVAAYKLGSAAIDVFTGKQKKAAAAAREHADALKNQAMRIKRLDILKKAGSGLATQIGVPLQRLTDEDRERGTALSTRAQLATAAFEAEAASSAEYAADAARSAEKLRALNADRRGFSSSAIAAVRKKLEADLALQAEKEARASRLRSKAQAAAAELKKFVDDLKADIKVVDAEPPDSKSSVGGGGRQKREPTPSWLEDEINLYLTGIERARQLHTALEALRPAWEAMVITPERVSAVASVMQDALTPLLPIADAATRAFEGVAASIAKAAQAMADGQAASRVWNSELDRMASFGALAGEGIAGAAVDALFFGESAQKMLAELAKATAREAAIESLKSTAKGFAALASPTTAALAPGHFKAAAVWAAGGGVAGAAGAVAGGGGGGGGRGALPPPTRRDLPRESGADGGLTINASIDLKSRPFATDRDVEAAMLRGVTNALQRAGGGGRAFRREISQ